MERSWLRPALERHPDLARRYSGVLGLGLVPAGLVGKLLSTAEIADEMFISVNTVKSHLKSSFRKLGVADRREAVRRARETGLL